MHEQHHGPNPTTLTRRFAKLTRLTLSHVRWSGAVVDLIGSFHEIDTLIIKNIAEFDSLPSLISCDKRSNGIRVRSLSFDQGTWGARQVCFAALSAIFDPSSLTILTLDCLSSILLPDLEAFLRDTGRNLHHLRYWHDEDGLGETDPGPAFHPLSLSHCPTLKSLHLVINLDLYRWPGYDGAVQWTGTMHMIQNAVHLLETVKQIQLVIRLHNHWYPTRERKSIEEECHLIRGLEIVKWDLLDEATCGYTSLQKIGIKFVRATKGFIRDRAFLGAVKAAEETLRTRMPRRARDLLHIQYSLSVTH
ncbi:hypothetical protein PHLCEN_2v3465 [Hermanssonia centrifuga]|uniref:Uncharacterized protein n=1 Tax=Hermanssonia centrifuga TaxID=98765 RepID=A0A2R6QIM1_9APHY|nr:hypothetical protein PHLCEN_2v3465 [Hermanssonia centrifuga]